MTTPTGLLEWGQSGNYNGIDDRQVIAALAQGCALGIVGAPPTLTAQSGLTIAIGPWAAIVNCGDGTRAVIGSRTTQTIAETAGGGSARTDVIWADINVDGGSWSASIVASPVSPTRTGVALGTITVPAGAATAAAMTFTPVLCAVSGSYSTFDPTTRTVTQTSLRDLTATLTIPANEPQVGDIYEIEVVGHGTWPTGTAQTLTLQPNLGGAGAGVTYAAAYLGSGNTFRCRYIIRVVFFTVGASGSYISTLFGELSGNGSLNPAGAANQMTSGMVQGLYNPAALDTTVAQTLKLQAMWGGANGTINGDFCHLRRRGIGLG